MEARKTGRCERKREPHPKRRNEKPQEGPQEKDKKQKVERKREEERGEMNQELGSERKAQGRSKQYGEDAQERRRAKWKGPQARPKE